MSGLLFLNTNDFTIQKGSKGNIMCNGIPGFALILFYSTHCVHCQNLIPIFKRLPGTIGGCQFGMINVSSNKQCVAMSKNTIAPITYVPYIILYFNGKPYMVYKGPYDANELKKFIIEVAGNLQKKQKFAEAPKQPQKGGKKAIPDYTVGIPIYGFGSAVTYLDFEIAYPEEKKY